MAEKLHIDISWESGLFLDFFIFNYQAFGFSGHIFVSVDRIWKSTRPLTWGLYTGGHEVLYCSL